MIHPFQGIRPTPEAGPAGHLVTHPYDKIGPEDLVRFRNLSPWSAVHLIRGESGPDDRSWYPDSLRRVREWLASGILARDPAPAFYTLRQEFVDHSGAPRLRTAIIGSLDLHAQDRVLPHERTHARAREDRYLLLRATGMHYGLVFLLRAGGPSIPSWAVDRLEPLAEVRGLEAADHRFGAIRDPDAVSAIAAALADGPYVIADGHHRFATACRMASEDPGAARVLVGVVDGADPGLVVLPTHRLLRGIDPGAVRSALAGLGARRFEAGERPWEAVAAAGPGTIGLIGPGGSPSLLWTPAHDGGSAADRLDVAVLDRRVLGPLLQGLDAEEHLSYHREPVAAFDAVRRGSAALLALVAPIAPSTVIEIARRREVMPQKSTDFYPKLPTGFVYLPAREGGP